MNQKIRHFFHSEMTSGVALIIAAAFAMIMANLGWGEAYHNFLHMDIAIVAGSFTFGKTAHHWINDGLMAIFFFLIGLEIKREAAPGGLLSTRTTVTLPALAAIGGIIVPALLYAVFNHTSPHNLRGWAIPSATDIAFALGVLALLGPRIPPALRILLMTIAVIDDLGAIIIIAIFYTAKLSLSALGGAALCIAALAIARVLKVKSASVYIVIGFLLWTAVLQSGVHATLAGVTTALFIPPEHIRSMTKGLHLWVAYAIMPLFAFANAGVSFAGLSPAALLAPVPLGIGAGLLIGKPLGITAAIWLATKNKLAALPAGINWRHIHGMAILCGIGFTMSLFIGGLAFTAADEMRDVRLGILTGSLLSAFAGYFILKHNCKEKQP